MPYKAPTLSTLIARNQADIESRLPGTYARTAFRTTHAIAYANAGNAAGLHDHLAWTSRQVIPHLADDDKLLEHCEFWGVWRKTATNARGTLTVTVSAETLIPGGTRWQRPDGVVFESIDDVHAVAGDNPVSVTAIETGRTGNTAEGVPLELISPVVNVQTQARSQYIGAALNRSPLTRSARACCFGCNIRPPAVTSMTTNAGRWKSPASPVPGACPVTAGMARWG